MLTELNVTGIKKSERFLSGLARGDWFLFNKEGTNTLAISGTVCGNNVECMELSPKAGRTYMLSFDTETELIKKVDININ